TLRIPGWDTSCQEPAIVSRTALDAVFYFVCFPGVNGCTPHLPTMLLIIGMDKLEPAYPFKFFAGPASIVTPASIPILSSAIGAQHPDKVRDGIDQSSQVFFGSLARSNIDADHDEVLTVVVRTQMRGNCYLKILRHPLSGLKQGLKT